MRHLYCVLCFFFKQKTAYEMRISDWSSDVCSSDLIARHDLAQKPGDDTAAATDHHILEPRHASLGRRQDGALQFVRFGFHRRSLAEIGRASCRERVCQYV